MGQNGNVPEIRLPGGFVSDVVQTIMWWQDRCWRGIEAAAAAGDSAGTALRAAGVIEETQAGWAWVADHQHELEDGIRAKIAEHGGDDIQHRSRS